MLVLGPLFSCQATNCISGSIIYVSLGGRFILFAVGLHDMTVLVSWCPCLAVRLHDMSILIGWCMLFAVLLHDRTPLVDPIYSTGSDHMLKN